MIFKEFGEMLELLIGKFGVNYRFRKIEEIVIDLKKKL